MQVFNFVILNASWTYLPAGRGSRFFAVAQNDRKVSIQEENLQLKTLLNDAGTLALVVSPKALEDGIYAALALKEQFMAQGKTVTIIYPAELPMSVSSLPEAKEVTTSFGDSSLVVTLDTSAKPIEKVSYFLEGNLFNLVLNSVPRGFDPSKVKVTTRAQKYDLIMVLGAKSLEDLGQFLQTSRRDLENNAVINLDYHNDNNHFGTLDIIDPEAKSLCEMLFFKFSQWELRPTPAAAKWLSLGLAK